MLFLLGSVVAKRPNFFCAQLLLYIEGNSAFSNLNKKNSMALNEILEAKMLESMGKQDNHWSTKTALWVIAAVVVLAILAWLWNRGCDQKAQLGVAIAKLDGRVDALEPAVTAQGDNLYKLNGATAATVQGVKDLKEVYGADIYELNSAVFYGARHRGGDCGCGNRTFKQTQTYNLASTNVTVDDVCRS